MMKVKRYFCDYWYGTGKPNKIPIIIMILLLLVTISVSIFIHLSIYENRIDSYSEKTYMFIDENANASVKEKNVDEDMEEGNSLKQKIILISTLIGIGFWFIIMGIGVVLLGIIARVSKNNKNKMEQQLS